MRDDFVERAIEGERLDGGGQSRVLVRVANVLPYTVLKIFAFQDRHENKGAYDLVFTLLNHQDGPRGAGRLAATSPVAQHPQVIEALTLLEERFRDAAQDGPNAYVSFLASPDDEEERRACASRQSLPCVHFSTASANRVTDPRSELHSPTLKRLEPQPPSEEAAAVLQRAVAAMEELPPRWRSS